MFFKSVEDSNDKANNKSADYLLRANTQSQKNIVSVKKSAKNCGKNDNNSEAFR